MPPSARRVKRHGCRSARVRHGGPAGALRRLCWSWCRCRCRCWCWCWCRVVRWRAACLLHPQRAVAAWACDGWHSCRGLQTLSVCQSRHCYHAHLHHYHRHCHDHRRRCRHHDDDANDNDDASNNDSPSTSNSKSSSTYRETRTAQPARSADTCRTAAGPGGCTFVWRNDTTHRLRDCACWRRTTGGHGAAQKNADTD